MKGIGNVGIIKEAVFKSRTIIYWLRTIVAVPDDLVS